MRWVIKYAIKSMKQNWLRNMLIALGAALGVMLATMLLLGNQSVEKSVKEQVVSRYGDYNLQFGYIKNDMYLNNESLKGIDGLENAEKISKVLIPYPFPNYKELSGKPSYWGVEQDSPEMHSYKIVEGRYPKEGAEVALTKGYTDRENIRVGDTIKLPFPQHGEKNVKVVGILNPPLMAAMGHSAYFPIHWLQKELNLSNQFNLVQVKTADVHVKRAIALDVNKKIENIKVDQRTYVDKAFERLNVMKPLIFSLGGIALFVVALLIMGSFFLSVRSRFKQWALLRALGSNPNQIILVVLLEALCIGAIGSLAGVILGAGTQTIAASFINKWVNIEGAGKASFSISGEVLLITFLLGIIMSVIGAIIPAFMVRKFPPVQVLRPGLPSNEKKEKRWSAFSLSILIIGTVIGLTGSILEQYIGFNPSAIGALLFAVGLLLAIPLFIRVIAPVIAKPFQMILRVETTISSRNVIRYRNKAAVSVAILAFGFMLALVGTMYVNSMYEGMKKGLQKHLPADLVVRIPVESQGIETLPFSWMEKVRKIGGVEASVGNATDFTAKLVNYDFKKANQEWYEFMKKNNLNYDSMEVVGNDIVAYQKVTKAKVIAGQALNKPLQDGEGVITKEVAKNLGLQLHDTIEVQGKGKEKQTIKVVSIIEQGLRLRSLDIFVNEQWARDKFHVQGYEAIQIMTNSNQSFEVIKKQVKEITKNKENVEVINSYDLLKEQEQLLSQMMMLIRLLVVIVFIISGIGLMNAIVASLHERRAEISMIRAVGAIPKQMRRIVLLEGTLLGAIAGCIGIFGGILFSYIVLSSLELTVIIIPYNQVVILALASVILGAGAAWIASLQLRKFKLSDTLKELSA
ncbi:FtsX-like permease family protein [Bacillus albus]|uniref:FtsX-like permease family protein n=1 Tax=Bacillus cereus group TaxID=86661 RepID=UPI0022E127A4|nr:MULTISPECIES: FtsX-like permease family protein [Bacillus cereus group]MDA2029392.1 ABC transporter permease [Bacillus cereus group sp. Bcc03]MDA2215499.1 ABC transporter permease [Bacillus cereus group sp. Bc228]MDA2227458.1 ABC transporter permease [Bacillus cereus group sp. Bc227]MDA2715943.1 ABC transporter permease [Bacillus cereus group sp. Bc025]HDR7715556.1 ABC transporter permease [Bacillus albus]